MGMYISLMKLTEQGIKDIKNAPERVDAAAKGLEAMGAKLLAFYLVMGDYDYVAITEGPSDEAAVTFLLGLGATGNVRTTTMKAFPLDAFKALVGRLP